MIYKLGLVILSLCLAPIAYGDDWQERQNRANGKEVFFHAWGGSQTYNNYIAWVASQVGEQYNVNLRHVKITNTADSIQQILSEKQADKDNSGSVDMIWINGENFARMKKENLLNHAFTHQLPNYNKYIDEQENPAILRDFDTPTDGLEAPWGMAQFIYIHDALDVPNPPKHANDLLEYAKANKGKITYPAPPDFTGITFIKQIASEILADSVVLQHKPPENYQQYLQPLWAYFDELHQYAWRDGIDFPKNESQMINLLNNREIDIAYSFNISAAANAIAKRQLPPSARGYVPEKGSIANVHFLAIPYNSNVKNAAMVVINFMLSPMAQARKQNPNIWGEPTVLSMKRLDRENKAYFDELPKNNAIPNAKELLKKLHEPHSAWVDILKDEWLKRYRK